MDLAIAIVLTLTLVSLKLVGSITTPWLAALSPLLAWIGLVLVLFSYKLCERLREKT